jgi:hypothetical protein
MYILRAGFFLGRNQVGKYREPRGHTAIPMLRRGRAFVRSARERRNMGRGPSAQAFSVFCLFLFSFFLKVFWLCFFTDFAGIFFPHGFFSFAGIFSNF